MRKLIYLFLFTTILVQGYTQSMEFSWARKAGGNFTDEGNSVTTDLNANVIVSGTFTSDSISFGGISITKADSTTWRMFVAKYDSSGNALWAKSAVTPSAYKSTTGFGVATDANGNVFVAGDMQTDSVNFDGSWIVFDNASYSFVAKYDPNGNFVWLRKAFGGYGTYGLAVDGNGDVLLAAKGAISFDGTLVTNNGTGRHCVVKYNNSGNYVWSRFATFSLASSYGFNAEWENKTVYTDSENNVYMAGFTGLDTIFFDSTKTIYVANNAFLRNAFLVKYNSNGLALWAKGAEKAGGLGNSALYPEGIFSTSNFVYLTGWWEGDSLRFGNNQITATNNQNMFVAKFDTLGNNIWVKSFGSEGYDNGEGLSLDNAGNVYVVGTTKGYHLHYNNTPIDTISGGNHASIFKIDPNGNLLDYLQAQNLPFYGTSFGNAIAIDALDNIFVTGSFQSGVTFGNDTLTSFNLWDDVFVCKLFNDYATGINALAYSNNNLKIYPNPSSEWITIDVSGKRADSETEIGIYSLTGSLVKKEKFQGNLIKMNVEELVNGVYMISVYSTGSFETQKIIIQR